MAANNSSVELLRITESEKILFTTGLIILSVLTLFGNTLVVIAFYTYRPLRTHTNYFIVSLSLSDILVALVSMPVWITFIIMDMDFKLLNGKLLQAWTCVDIMTGVASILNLTAVSVDRYIHVTKPLTHSKLITRSRVLSTILLIWVFSLGISLLKGLMFEYWQKNKPSYETLIVSIGFVIPLAIVMYCYLRIYQEVKNQVKKFMEQTKCLHSENRQKTDVKAIKTIAIVVLAFFICWCPFFVLNLFSGWCRYYNDEPKKCFINTHLIRMAKWLHYTNSSLNPIIYACFNREFRNGFKIALYKRLSSSNTTNSAFSNIIKRTSIRSAIYEPNSPAVFLTKPRSSTYDCYAVKRDSIVSTNFQDGRSKKTTRSSFRLAIPSSV